MRFFVSVIISIFFIIFGSYSAFGEPVGIVGNATIVFSDGRTGSITYNEVTNTSTMLISDGHSASTTYNDITKTAHTIYSNGKIGTSSFNDITQTSHTIFSDGLTANTSFNNLTNTLHTTFSDGATAITSYNKITNTATTTVFGIFLLPSMSKIKFSPQSTKIKKIFHVKDLKPGERESEGWIRNEIRDSTSVPSKAVD
jgi:hypothetical protein